MCQFRHRKRKSLSTETSLIMAEARKRAKALLPPREDIETFVLRRSPDENVFFWQIRLFGGVILLTSDVSYPNLEAARDAGVLAQDFHCQKSRKNPTSSIQS